MAAISNRKRPCSVGRTRHGLATLEFAMCLPLLLTLFVLIAWLGVSVAAQTEMTVKARNDAWRQRFEDKSKKPFVFTTNRLQYSADDDFAVGKASTRVDVSPVFDSLPQPEAEFTVLSGAWDHRALPMNEPPSWTQYAYAAGNAATAEIQQLIGSLDVLVNDLSGTLGSQIDNQLNEGNDIENQSNGIDSSTKTEEQRNEAEKERERDELEARRRAIFEELLALDAELITYRARLPLSYDEKTETEEMRIDRERVEAAIALRENQKARLQSELRDVNSDLESL